MSPIKLVLVLFLLSGSLLFAQTGAELKSKSLSLDAVRSIGKRDSKMDYVTSMGSYKKDINTSTRLTITARNLSPQLSGEFLIEWWFLGKDINGTHKFVQTYGNKVLTLKPNTSEIIEAESHPETVTTHHSFIGGDRQSGERIDGWIVRARCGDEIVRIKASSAQLEDLAANKAEFERFTAEK